MLISIRDRSSPGFSSIVTSFVCFPNIPGKQQHFNLTNEKLVYYFMGNQGFFGQKLTLPCKQLVSPTPNERETAESNRSSL